MSRKRASRWSSAALGLALFLPAGAAEIPPAELKGGAAFMGDSTKAMQDDPTANPGMLAILDGESAWSRPEGAAKKSCAECHGADAAQMKGVAARYPAFDDKRGRAIDLDQRINFCRADHQQATPFRPEARELLALSAFVTLQSAGVPIAPPDDPRMTPVVTAGKEIYDRRQGQLNLSCAICHDDHWGKRLAAAIIPQAHPDGYPIYRLEWQGMGSLQRRLRNCMIGMRSEPYAVGAPETIALEAYLMSRASGLPVEAPSVRP